MSTLPSWMLENLSYHLGITPRCAIVKQLTVALAVNLLKTHSAVNTRRSLHSQLCLPTSKLFTTSTPAPKMIPQQPYPLLYGQG